MIKTIIKIGEISNGIKNYLKCVEMVESGV